MRPSQRISRDRSQEQGFRRHPTGQPAEPCHIAQSFGALLQFEVAKIFLHDVGHRHPQPRGKVSHRHCLLLLIIPKEPNQTIRQGLPVPSFVEFDCQFLTICHLSKICDIRTHDRDAVSTRQVSDSAAPSRRAVRHNRHRRTLKQRRKLIFIDVTSEFNSRVVPPFSSYRFDITRSLRMVSSRDHQLGVGNIALNYVERFENEFESFVSPPFAKRQNAVIRIASAREVGIFRSASQGSVRSHMYVVPAILFIQYPAISGHQDRH